MPKTIKFRAWDKKEHKMVQVWDLHFSHTPMSIGVDSKMRYSFVVEATQIKGGNELEIMQYTGLKDKNGVEIYEDDVVRISGFGLYKVEFPFIELYEAVAEGDVEDIKGNIYENPELLK